MTINDLLVNECGLKIRKLAEQIPYLEREGREQALFIAFADIEKLSREAQERLNYMRFDEDAE